MWKNYMAWYDASWGYRVKVTVLAAKVDADITNFPIYVNLNNLPAGFHTHVNQTDARDIRVTKADGTTEIPREVVFYAAATDTGELHFKGDVLDASDVDFYIYYGNAAATEPAEDATYGRENVWNSSYEAVYHFQQNPETTAQLDSTSHDRDGTSSGTMLAEDSVDGALAGKALDFDNSNDYITAGAANLTGAHTITMWLYCKGFPGVGDYDVYLDSQTTEGSGNNQYNTFTDNTKVPESYGSGFSNANTALPTTTWIKISQTFDGTAGHAQNWYKNGTADGTPALTKAGATTGYVHIGARSGSQYVVNAIIDEVRIMNALVAGTYISTEYNNQSSPSTFYNLGAEEPLVTTYSKDTSTKAYILGWYNASWNYRVRVSTLATKVDADLTDFPVYVSLANLPAGFHSNCNQTDARDIRVTTSDGVTEVPREIVFYDAATDTGEMFFKGTIADATNTDFYIYYGNGSATEPTKSDTYGAGNTWNSNYLAVYHLQEAANIDASGYKDATNNNNHGTGVSMAIIAPAGKLSGKAAEFDGAADRISTPRLLTNNTWSMTCWAFIHALSGSNGNPLYYQEAGGSNLGQEWGLIDAYPTASDETFFGRSGGATLATGNDVNWAINNWYHFGATFNNTACSFFYNGGSGGSGTVSGGTPADQLGCIAAWYNYTDALRYLDGVIDEVRITDNVLTSTWISTEYNNLSIPSDFYSVGTQESQSSGISYSQANSIKVNIKATLSKDTSGKGSITVTGQQAISAKADIKATSSFNNNLRSNIITTYYNGLTYDWTIDGQNRGRVQ